MSKGTEIKTVEVKKDSWTGGWEVLTTGNGHQWNNLFATKTRNSAINLGRAIADEFEAKLVVTVNKRVKK